MVVAGMFYIVETIKRITITKIVDAFVSLLYALASPNKILLAFFNVN